MALAGRTPSGPAPVSAAPEAFEAFENFSTLPQVGPHPIERPVAGGVVAAQTRQVASSYPLETQARPPQGRSVESAYASAPQAKTPQVMFGNMVLEGPKAAQKPVR
ncbi:septal ring lytic transglycosylase RlpA family protein, partial [Neorhizobium sp. SHOUNA12A]|nr:septal ring lytic transglycosylase RlpA family protein [Neorhizobium sp. SHOUNA12A]